MFWITLRAPSSVMPGGAELSAIGCVWDSVGCVGCCGSLVVGSCVSVDAVSAFLRGGAGGGGLRFGLGGICEMSTSVVIEDCAEGMEDSIATIRDG